MTFTVRASRKADSERANGPSPNRALVLTIASVVVVVMGLARFVLTEPEVVQPTADPVTTVELVASLEAQVASNPEDLLSWQQLGTAYLHAATEIGNPSFYSRAATAFDEAAALDPGNPNTAVGVAVLALARHDFELASRTATALVSGDPFNSQGLLVLVDAEIELGRYEEAATHLQQLLDLKPALPALSRTSYLRELHGDLLGAEQVMIQALTAGSRSTFDVAVTMTLLGDLYLKRGELERADERYLEAQDLAPDLLTAGIGRARVAVAGGRFDVAADLLEGVVERFPEPGALTLLGEVQAARGLTGDGEQAFATVGVIADLQREAGAIVDLELARFMADHGDPDQALTLARAAYDTRPTVFAAQVLAWSLHQSGDSVSALPYAQEAHRLGTADASLLLQAAAIAAANGDHSLAEDLRSEASGLDPWFLVLHPELDDPWK
jgi:cytochrome c-type biogenesis protein CcmH/NrfG